MLLLLWEGEKGTGEELRLRGQFSVVDSCGPGGASDVVADDVLAGDATAVDATVATYGDAAIVAILRRGGTMNYSNIVMGEAVDDIAVGKGY